MKRQATPGYNRPRRGTKTGNPTLDLRQQVAETRARILAAPDADEAEPLQPWQIAPAEWWSHPHTDMARALKSACWRLRFDRFQEVQSDACLVEIESNMYAPGTDDREEETMRWLQRWFLEPFGLVRQADIRAGRGLINELWTGRLPLSIEAVKGIKEIVNQRFGKGQKDEYHAALTRARLLMDQYGAWPTHLSPPLE